MQLGELAGARGRHEARLVTVVESAPCSSSPASSDGGRSRWRACVVLAAAVLLPGLGGFGTLGAAGAPARRQGRAAPDRHRERAARDRRAGRAGRGQQGRGAARGVPEAAAAGRGRAHADRPRRRVGPRRDRRLRHRPPPAARAARPPHRARDRGHRDAARRRARRAASPRSSCSSMPLLVLQSRLLTSRDRHRRAARRSSCMACVAARAAHAARRSSSSAVGVRGARGRARDRVRRRRRAARPRGAAARVRRGGQLRRHRDRRCRPRAAQRRAARAARRVAARRDRSHRVRVPRRRHRPCPARHARRDRRARACSRISCSRCASRSRGSRRRSASCSTTRSSPTGCWSSALGGDVAPRRRPSLHLGLDVRADRLRHVPVGRARADRDGRAARSSEVLGAAASARSRSAWAGAAWIASEVFQRKVGFTIWAGFPALALAVGVWLDALLARARGCRRGREARRAVRAARGRRSRQGHAVVHREGQLAARRQRRDRLPDAVAPLFLPTKLWILILGVHRRAAASIARDGRTGARARGPGSRVRARRHRDRRGVLGVRLAARARDAPVEQGPCSRPTSICRSRATSSSSWATSATRRTTTRPTPSPRSLTAREQVVQALGRPTRVFAIAPATELCQLHREVGGKPYFVLDDRNVHSRAAVEPRRRHDRQEPAAPR